MIKSYTQSRTSPRAREGAPEALSLHKINNKARPHQCKPFSKQNLLAKMGI